MAQEHPRLKLGKRAAFVKTHLLPQQEESGQGPAEDAVTGIGGVQLAAERGHRLPHDRVAQPQQHLMLLEPQNTPARDFLLHERRVEDQFHAVGA